MLRVQDNGDGLHRQIQRGPVQPVLPESCRRGRALCLGLGLLLVRQTAAFARRLPDQRVSEEGAELLPRSAKAESAGKQRPLLTDRWTTQAAGITAWWELSRELPAQLYEVRNIN